VAIALFAIHKSKLQNVKIKMQNVDNLFQIDSSKPIIDYYNKYKSKQNAWEIMRFLISFGMTKKECHCEHLKGAWQSHY